MGSSWMPGAKILGKDVAPYLRGHGGVLGYPDAVIRRLQRPSRDGRPSEGAPRPAIGTIVWVVPNHVCPVVNLVDDSIVAQGGRVVDRWPVDARGRNT